MISQKLPGYDLPMGAPSNWNEAEDGPCDILMVKADRYETATGGIAFKSCESAWKPTPEELELLNAGGYVVLHVVGRQPPVALWVEKD